MNLPIMFVILLSLVGITTLIFLPRESRYKDPVSITLNVLATLLGVYLAFYLTKNDAQNDIQIKKLRILTLEKKDFKFFVDRLHHIADSLPDAGPTDSTAKEFDRVAFERFPQISDLILSTENIFNFSIESVLAFEHSNGEFQYDLRRMDSARTNHALRKAFGLFYRRASLMLERIDWEIQYANSEITEDSLRRKIDKSDASFEKFVDSLYPR
jgi:hypothetical protein